jgi:hybrid cluster-associated redox disulfide protein
LRWRKDIECSMVYDGEMQAANPQSDLTGFPQMTLAELASRWPRAILILARRQMACPGCGMAAFETLEEACQIYEISIDELLEEILLA